MSFQMYVPTRILFGEGQLEGLHKQKLPGKKAMIVISNGKSTKRNGALENWQVRKRFCLTKLCRTH